VAPAPAQQPAWAAGQGWGAQAAAPPVAEGFGFTPDRLARVQAALKEAKVDGWLFADFRRSDPIAYRVLNLDPNGARTRRWYCLVPAEGQPRKLLHVIEPRSLDGVPGTVASYASWRERDKELARLLQGMRKVAMDWSPRNEIPTVSRVDAGTTELVRSFGPEPVTAAELIAQVASTLDPAELADQARTAELLGRDLEAVAQEAARRVRDGIATTERDLQEFAVQRWRGEGLGEDGDRPIVAVDAHAADPHYAPAAQGSSPVVRGSLLLLDFATRKGKGPHAIPGDLTRVYYLGDKVPSEVARVAEVVFRARDAALALLRRRLEHDLAVTGAEVDQEARRVVAQAGFGERFLHRTGHSIDVNGHGDGVNNDDFETHDTRRHSASTCFSIEPGVYLTGRFGIRSEIDACLLPGPPGGQKLLLEVRGGPLQNEVPALLAAPTAATPAPAGSAPGP
jgi:Xaa-Pro aminopeptidase